MSFLAGSVSAVQFSAAWPEQHAGREAELLRACAAEPCVFNADGEACGWTAGGHRRDTRFGEKNVLGDFLAFDFRRTKDAIPGALVRDYTAEIMAEMQAADGGQPLSAKKKRVAREQGRERAEEEAKDGRFKRHTLVPVVWDRQEGRVLFGSGSSSLIDRFVVLFEKTFGVVPQLVSPATIAGADLRGLATQWVPGVTPDAYLWSPDVDHPNHLGNEFALWLMWRADRDGGEIADKVLMVARTISLDCPRGHDGFDTVRHESPARLPEVRKALQSGKLPRSLGLTLVAYGEQYELTLHADRWAVTAGRLPKPGDDAPTAPDQRAVYRLESVRAMFQAVESLFGFFCEFRRDAEAWEREVRDVRGWLGV